MSVKEAARWVLPGASHDTAARRAPVIERGDNSGDSKASERAPAGHLYKTRRRGDAFGTEPAYKPDVLYARRAAPAVLFRARGLDSYLLRVWWYVIIHLWA